MRGERLEMEETGKGKEEVGEEPEEEIESISERVSLEEIFNVEALNDFPFFDPLFENVPKELMIATYLYITINEMTGRFGEKYECYPSEEDFERLVEFADKSLDALDLTSIERVRIGLNPFKISSCEHWDISIWSEGSFGYMVFIDPKKKEGWEK